MQHPSSIQNVVTRTAIVLAAVAALGGGGQAHARPGLLMAGINLSGAEFGAQNLPGTYNTDYTYPTPGEIDYFTSKRMDTFRLPFRWERLQQSQNATLNATELSRMVSFVNYATSKGANVIIDPHNFARYYPTPAANIQDSSTGIVGVDVPNSSFANLWSQIASVPQFKNNSHVIFNLMNEPANVNTDTWVGSANAAITSIRAAGASNLILVPGNRYSGAWQWYTSDSNGRSNALAMLSIKDTGNNYAFDVHQYMDNDGSGTSATITNNDPTIGVQRLTAFTNWCITNHRRGFLGEFGIANSTIGTGAGQIGDETLSNMLNYMSQNSDVWMGWQTWGGGPWWPNNYIFHADPINGVDAAIMPYLIPHGAVVPEPCAATASLLACLGLIGQRRRTT